MSPGMSLFPPSILFCTLARATHAQRSLVSEKILAKTAVYFSHEIFRGISCGSIRVLISFLSHIVKPINFHLLPSRFERSNETNRGYRGFNGQIGRTARSEWHSIGKYTFRLNGASINRSIIKCALISAVEWMQSDSGGKRVSWRLPRRPLEGDTSRARDSKRRRCEHHRPTCSGTRGLIRK